MKISSPAFIHFGKIPRRYTCEGDEINPPLFFSDLPKNTKSLVLIMEDPDVPKQLRKDGMWDHWILFNIDPVIEKIDENTTPPSKQGVNSSGMTRYDPPCPPDTEHRYFFKLFALNKMLELPTGSTKKDVEKAMEGHIMDQCELVGLYEKKDGKLLNT